MNRAFIITTRSSIRSRLRQLAEFSGKYGGIHALTDFDEAYSLISTTSGRQIVFVGSELDSMKAAKFVNKCKKSLSAANQPTFILVFRPEESQKIAVANNMMVGFHGFLCEPLSLEAVSDVPLIADKVSNGGSAVRLKAATGLLLSDLKDQEGFDDGEPGDKTLWEEIQESCQLYNEVTQDSLTAYVENKLRKMTPEQRLEGADVARSNLAKGMDKVRKLIRKRASGFNPFKPRKKPSSLS